MQSVALLILRATIGSLLAGHGAQKLFGSFGGYGVEGTAGFMETMNLRPGHRWAILAGVSEFGGGLLTALGALNPLGPIMAIGSMLTATLKPHRGKPIWVTSGGAELPVTNIAAMAALTLAGPGRLSVDGLFGIRVPRWFGLAAFATMIAGVVYAVRSSEASVEVEAPAAEQSAGAHLAAGREKQMEPRATGESPEETPGSGTGPAADRPDVEAWGSPRAGEPVQPAAVAAINRETL